MLLFLITLIKPVTTYAQLLGEDLLNGRKSVEIPFKYTSGFIILDIKYNNILPLKFIYDTGAANTILFDRTYSDIFNYEYKDTIKIIGADISSQLEGYVVRHGLFKLPSRKINTKRDYIVLSKDYMDMEKSTGIAISGILGSDFFKRLAVKIDYRRQILTLIDPDKLTLSKKWTTLPIEIINGKPYLTTTIYLDSEPITLRLLLDTGASISLLIHPQNTNIDIPKNSISGYLGTGLSGNIIGHIGLINKLDIGPYNFKNLITNFQNIEVDSSLAIPLVRDGLIGNLLLSKFDIVIDYIKGTLYLKPNKYYNKELKVDRSGIIIHAFGQDLQQFLVHFVYENSPAAKAGIKKGDIVVGLGRCRSQSLSLHKITKKLSKKVGTKIKLKVNRNQELLKLDLILDELIKKSDTS